MQLKIRKASPVDVKQAVPLIYSSGPAAFEYVFSVDFEGQAKGFLKYAFKRNFGAFSHRQHMIAELKGSVVGSMVNYSSANFIRLTLGNVKAIVGYFGVLTGVRVMYRGILMETLIRPPKKGCFYVGHLGVNETKRGQGIGQALIANAQERAGKVRLPFLSLDVSEQNPGAERLYQRLGFKPVETRVFRHNRPSLPVICAHHYMEATVG